MFAMGTHLVEDLSRLFRIESDDEVGVEGYEFDQTRECLAAAGWTLRPAKRIPSRLFAPPHSVAVALQQRGQVVGGAADPMDRRSPFRALSQMRHQEVAAQVASR